MGCNATARACPHLSTWVMNTNKQFPPVNPCRVCEGPVPRSVEDRFGRPPTCPFFSWPGHRGQAVCRRAVGRPGVRLASERLAAQQRSPSTLVGGWTGNGCRCG